MLYHLYELNQAALSPARAAAEAYRLLFRNPLNPASHTPLGRGTAAALELFERTTRRYRKPAWDIPTTDVDGLEVAVRPRRIIAKPFCNLVYFERDIPLARRRKDSKLLIVAPMARPLYEVAPATEASPPRTSTAGAAAAMSRRSGVDNVRFMFGTLPGAGRLPQGAQAARETAAGRPLRFLLTP